MSSVGPLAPAVLAAVAVGVAFVSRARPGPRRLGSLGAGHVRELPPRPGLLARLGAPVRRRLGAEPDPRGDRLAGLVAVTTVALLGAVPPLALGLAVGSATLTVVRRRRAARRAHDALVDELPEVVDLLWLSVAAGLTVPLALGVVERHGTGRLAAELGRARRRAEVGSGLADALDDVPSRLGDPVRPVTRALAGAVRDGTSLAGPLERVADEVRVARRRAAEERARRVSVRLLFPLVCCVLPAFALLTVVPLLAGALRGLDL